MNWMQRLANWFGGTKKSRDSVGIGLRAVLSGGVPGGWASDHREETSHNTGFNYIAIHAIAAQVGGATVTVFADGDQQLARQSRRKSLAARTGSFALWKSTYGADDRETEPLPASHPLVQLLKHPNRSESGANFRYRQAQQIRLTGTCLVWNVPSLSGPACERYVIPTAMASPVAPTNQLPCGGWRINPVVSRYTPIFDEGYIECPSWYRILGQIVDARQIQVIRLPHAWYLDDGQSPISAAATWVDAGEAVDFARYHQLRNGVNPSVVWNLPPDVSPDQDEIDRVQAKISAKYGGPENVGRVMVAQSGTTITPLTTSPKDMCYTEGFHDFKAAILALHQTPPVAVGLQEPGAYAAYNASMKAWRHAAIQPLCDMLAESDTEHLAPQFGTGLTIEIESDTVDDAQLIEQQLQNDLAAKVRTKNEWRAVRGMPPLPSPLGDALVGTDSDNSHSQSSEASNGIDGNSELPSNPHGGTDTKSRQPKASLTEAIEKPSLHDRDDMVAGAAESIDADAAPPTVREDESEDEDAICTELIAEILFGLYGQSAMTLAPDEATSSEKAFNPELHPRDHLGRFALRDSADIQSARSIISNVLSGKLTFGLSGSAVMDSLHKLSTQHLRSIHEEFGVTPPPHLRSHLIASVRARLGGVTGDVETPASRLARNSTSTNVAVYVQHPDELNSILERKISHEQWGQLVGAQAGAQVHVFKGDGLRSIHIEVKHPDYWAKRTIRKDSITNSEFYVVPDKQGHGIGTRVLAQQVQAASRLDFRKIEVDALGEGQKLHHESDENSIIGYYTWARLGFDGRIDHLMRERLYEGTESQRQSAIQFFRLYPKVKYVSELMENEVDREWWKDFGRDFQGTFILRHDSKSRRILDRYLQEKQEERLKSLPLGDPLLRGFDHVETDIPPVIRDDRTATAPSLAAEFIGELPDQLTAEDEMILDRIWDEIGKQTGGDDTIDADDGKRSFRSPDGESD